MNKHTLFTAGSIVIICVVTFFIAHTLNARPVYTTVTVTRAAVTSGVTASGVVQSGQNISLSFQTNGTVAAVPAVVGTAVHRGQVLAALNAGDAAAAVAQAHASAAAAEANYEKVLSGATSAQIDVATAALATAQTALENAKLNFIAVQAQQDTTVQNAKVALFNATISAEPAVNNVDTVVPVLTGTYHGTDPVTYTINIVQTGEGAQFQVSGPDTFFGDVRSVPVAIGQTGLSIQFFGTPSAADTWSVVLPNSTAPTYLTNQNNYTASLKMRDTQNALAQAQVSSTKSAVEQAQANLTLLQTAARPEDVAMADAGRASAAAQVALAESAYAKTTISAPIDGVISVVNAKIGQSVSPNVPQISMISAGKYQVELYVSEADLGSVAVGDAASVTLDAYGTSVPFVATVASIDPAATIMNNTSAYKVTLLFSDADPRIKDGMAANCTITHETHEAVLQVPANTLIKKDNAVFVLKRATNGSFTNQQVTTGVTGLNGAVEILSGITEGDQVASFAN